MAGSHVLIAANPKSGAKSGRAKVGTLHAILSQRGLTVDICESLDELQQKSHALAETQLLHSVVAAGGDGTAAEVINRVPQGIAVSVLPLGTENLLAKHLGMTGDVEQCAATVTDGTIVQLDAGLANNRMFLVMLSCGFDAVVVEQMHSQRRGHINRWTYTKPIVHALRNYSYPRIRVHVEAQDCGPNAGSQGAEPGAIDFETAWFFAFNVPRYAANLQFCPQAVDCDGLLDLCTFERGGILRGVGYLAQLWIGRHQQLSHFRHARVKKFTLSSITRVPYQVDGDPGGELPLTVEVLPGRMTLLKPQASKS